MTGGIVEYIVFTPGDDGEPEIQTEVPPAELAEIDQARAAAEEFVWNLVHRAIRHMVLQAEDPRDNTAIIVNANEIVTDMTGLTQGRAMNVINVFAEKLARVFIADHGGLESAGEEIGVPEFKASLKRPEDPDA
jgi:hypothetical protein